MCLCVCVVMCMFDIWYLVLPLFYMFSMGKCTMDLYMVIMKNIAPILECLQTFILNRYAYVIHMDYFAILTDISLFIKSTHHICFAFNTHVVQLFHIPFHTSPTILTRRFDPFFVCVKRVHSYSVQRRKLVSNNLFCACREWHIGRSSWKVNATGMGVLSHKITTNNNWNKQHNIEYCPKWSGKKSWIPKIEFYSPTCRNNKKKMSARPIQCQTCSNSSTRYESTNIWWEQQFSLIVGR